MNKRILGRTGIAVSEVGLGTWQIGGDVWGSKNDSESLAAIHTALEHGVTYIDTATGYGSGHAEELIGKALKEVDATGIVVSTKILPKCMKWAPPPEMEIDEFFPEDWIVSQCDQSLKRLGVERIDILFFHTWSPSWGHRTEWFDAMDRLKSQGKIKAIGISIPDEGIADANVHIEAGRVDVIQCVYNVFQQEPEYNLFPLAKKHGVGIIARSPFSSGALIGNWTKEMTFPEGDWRGTWPKGIKDNWLEEQVDMADAVRPIFEQEGLSMPTAAVRYILMNEIVASTIPGSGNPKHVQANISAAEAVPLSNDAMKQIKQLWLDRKIHGTYNGSI